MSDIGGTCGHVNSAINDAIHEVILLVSCLIWKIYGIYHRRVVLNNDVSYVYAIIIILVLVLFIYTEYVAM